MSSVVASFTWSVPPSAMADRVAAYKENLLNAIRELIDVYGGKVVEYAKGNAPWTDRTSNARQGLNHAIKDEGAVLGLVLYHDMDYGIWLEVRWGGRWAIIMRTLEFHYPKLMAALAALIR